MGSGNVESYIVLNRLIGRLFPNLFQTEGMTDLDCAYLCELVAERVSYAESAEIRDDREYWLSRAQFYRKIASITAAANKSAGENNKNPAENVVNPVL